jgi:hypothetical protein
MPQEQVDLRLTVDLAFRYTGVAAIRTQHLCLEDNAYPLTGDAEPPFPISARPDLFLTRVFMDQKRWMLASQGEHIVISDAHLAHSNTELASV